jgi:hypothetical protein
MSEQDKTKPTCECHLPDSHRRFHSAEQTERILMGNRTCIPCRMAKPKEQVVVQDKTKPDAWRETAFAALIDVVDIAEALAAAYREGREDERKAAEWADVAREEYDSTEGK